MFKHILLPTDGSELSVAAVHQGIRFAKSIGAKVTGLCVMPLQHTVFYHEKISKEALEEVAHGFKKQAETYLAAIEKGAKEAGVACDIVYERNDSPTTPSSGWLRRKAATSSLCDIANYDRFSDKNWVTLLLPSGS